MKDLIQSLNWRYATKLFDNTKKLSDEQVSTLSESLRLSASSFGLQAWKFLFISNDDVKQQLLPHSWNQKQVITCSHHVVFCYQDEFNDSHVDKFLTSISEQRGTSMEDLDGYGKAIKGFTGGMDHAHKQQWMKNQSYLALGSFLVTCAQLKIDACPMEGINQDEYDKILGLDKTGWKSSVACPVGFRSAEDQTSTQLKVRYPINDIVDFIK